MNWLQFAAISLNWSPLDLWSLARQEFVTSSTILSLFVILLLFCQYSKIFIIAYMPTYFSYIFLYIRYLEIF